jgi:hypothetical protein
MLERIDFSARAQCGVFADVRIWGHPSLAVFFFLQGHRSQSTIGSAALLTVRNGTQMCNEFSNCRLLLCSVQTVHRPATTIVLVFRGFDPNVHPGRALHDLFERDTIYRSTVNGDVTLWPTVPAGQAQAS